MATKKEALDIVTIKQESITFCVLGQTPLIMNKLSNKTKEGFLLPPKKKNQAERQSTAKHDPIAEFRRSPHTVPTGDTLLAMPSTAFKGALRSVALDMPGATKTQLGRLTYVEGQYVPVYGVPQIFLAAVRDAGINRTPDIRSRAIVPEWAAHVTVKYTVPMLNVNDISNLFAAAGLIVGVGDWRPQKGSGNFGTFSLVGPDDAEFLRIVESGKRDAQEAGMTRATPYDDETYDLLEWFADEADRRGFVVAK